jgi:hypothetical protein
MKTNIKYNLFLDDDERRIPNKLTWIALPMVDWTIVRTYDDFVNIIETQGMPEIVSLDHDLGDTAYQEYFRAVTNGGKLNYANIKEKTGYDCAMFLANYCIDNHIALPVYYVHSMNGPGCQNIESVMQSAYKVINGK